MIGQPRTPWYAVLAQLVLAVTLLVLAGIEMYGLWVRP